MCETHHRAHVHCEQCGFPAHADHRCNSCGRVLCWSCGHTFPTADIPVLDEDYETICKPCIGREYGVYYDLAAIENLTVLPCGHSVIHLHVFDQDQASCRACDARLELSPDAPI